MKEKKVVLITGGANALANEIAIALAKENKVIIHYNKSEKAAISALNLIGDKNCKLIQCDFNKEEAETFFKRSIELFGSLDVIINASSIFEKIDTSQLNKATLVKYYNIHSIFPLLLTTEFYKWLKVNNRKGSVVNITDATLEKNVKNRVPYYLSKESLSFQTKLLAKEFAPILRINEVAPGFTLAKKWEEEYFKKVDDVLPFKITKVEEINNVVKYFIASNQVSGQCVKVDSGLSILETKLV
jgi:pteridine reductase